mmetsp:Transcript_42358/g.57837  ORF Transcript_42358/g.57837 Transcript_42358/m.57837 type:complete len:82 (+) Transcript_42358:615-860(+)
MSKLCLGMPQNWRLTGSSFPPSVRLCPPDALSFSQPSSDRPPSALEQLSLLDAMNNDIGAESSSGDHYDSHGGGRSDGDHG